jgi:hypothetical protein
MIKQKPLFILAFILLFSGCASVVSIQVVDSDGKPIDELKLELQNNEGNTIAIAAPEGGGIYKISKNDISSDSFFVAIKSTEEYFPLEKRLSTSDKSNKLKLEDRMTAIVGYVLSDTEDTTPLGNCRVSTLPETIEATTDNTGKFLLKSEQFEEIEYTVFISKTDYMEGSTTFTPHNNEVDTLYQTIFLKPILKEEINIQGKGITVPIGADE